MPQLVEGFYDLLKTKELEDLLNHENRIDLAKWADLSNEELSQRLTYLLAREVSTFVSEKIGNLSGDRLREALAQLSGDLEELLKQLQAKQPVDSKALREILPLPPLVSTAVYPDTPLAVSALLTGSSRTPALRAQLRKELSSCDRADWLVSFIKYSGLVPLLDELESFTRDSSPDGQPKLRVATTSYMGATDVKAIETLLKLPNTEVRISYDTKRTRLHAKAYLFHRETGFASAYIGSANLSKAALDEGLEWTAKISQFENEFLWKHAVATFESHWNDDSEFSKCDIEDLDRFAQAVQYEAQLGDAAEITTFFDLRPYGFQEEILQDIAAEREVGLKKHLVIAATGTGKTMVAAFDYRKLSRSSGRRPRLLYIAHRKEILLQARASFRQVLRDGNFGECVFGGQVRTQNDHLFCTVQSWNSQSFDRFAPDHFEYVVLDEAHHAAADSYQAIIDHVQPISLLGLTATPERTDGKDIRVDFGGAFTHEIRLPEAVERALLSPFHYYGVPDKEGLDFSKIAWHHGGYDIAALDELVTGNTSRAQWVLDQTLRYVTDLRDIRALAFCVSVKHAQFMAEFLQSHGVPSIALSADTPDEVRNEARHRLEEKDLNFIFTVDLFNEGVDIPLVDTVLFLRPTESLTLFLQQLGRGLRLHEDKSHLTVLDFIAPQNRRFSYAQRFRALTSRPEISVEKQIVGDMPFVPSGCFVHLEKQAREHVLNNIRSATANMTSPQFSIELKQLSNGGEEEINLEKVIDYFGFETPDEVYKKGMLGVLLEEIRGNDLDQAVEEYSKYLKEGFRRLALIDDVALARDFLIAAEAPEDIDRLRLSLLHALIWGSNKPGDGSLKTVSSFIKRHRPFNSDLIDLLNWIVNHRKPIHRQQLQEISGPLNIHASYSRAQILLALGLGTFENPRPSREGVLHVPDRKLDVFFADINKSEEDFSPTTMYDDYAITERLFHWQSQSGTSPESDTGKRYIHHERIGYTPLLFIRDRKKLENGLTAPYFYAGPMKYVSHEGSKPISFEWELRYPLPASALSWARRIA